MRIGIVTFAESMNYGQRLQNFALEQTLISFGHKPETIMKHSRILTSPKQILLLKLNILLKRGLYNTGRRAISFDRFRRKRMHFSKDIYPNGSFSDYDLVVCGSDQIWNTSNDQLERSFYFAQFIAPEKRIAFSASLGTNDLTPDQLRYVAEKADEMKAVSVRERSSAQLLQPLCRNKIETTIDPVFLLTSSQWLSIAHKPTFVAKGEKYILTYFLGDLPPQTEAYVKRVSEELGLRVIRLHGVIFKEGFSDLGFGVGPEEFVYLMANSALTITDSFHAVAFSCIFQRPLRWFSRMHRSATNIRIENLFSLFSIADWAIGNSEEPAEHFLFCDYESVDEVIERERRHALNYLQNALKGDDDHA
ncbi:MAG: polysaccharide pyruvyl transferase family protein [Clostridia bacterium]|nr:polysaccharide pyruvyl transferase family protein [Clostridia bacterium]